VIESLKEKFCYCPETGCVTSLTSGSTGFNTTSGYLAQSMGRGKTLYCHRIAWMLQHGYIPDGKVVDHINGDKKDNRLCNLRLLSASENKKFRHKSKGNVRSKGVHFERSRNRYVANGMKPDGTTLYLGRFKTEQEAASAFARHVEDRGWGVA